MRKFLLFLAFQQSEGWAPRAHLGSHAAPFFHRETSVSSQSTVRSFRPLHMSLVPLPVDELDDLLVTGSPTGLQYAAYWGQTKREQYNIFLESSIVTFLGVFFSYFMSFVVGGFLATILGGIFAFWGVLSPDLKSRQRNWEFTGGRALVDPWTVDDYDAEDKQGLYGSLFLGRVDDVCVVEDTTATAQEYDLDEFMDYTMDKDELEQIAGTPYLLRVRLVDAEERELQVHARLSEEYLDVEAGMPVVAILLSKSQSFSSLAALTDVMIPDADCWVGDYPYLNRVEMEALLADDDELWDNLRSEGRGAYAKEDELLDDDSSDDDEDADDSGLANLLEDDREKVKIRRRGRRY
jgi:hypothetical protein